MERIAARKIHFAPYARQQRSIERLLREGKARDVTDLMRRALDCYFDRLGRPSLMEQATQMSEDARLEASRDAASLQDASRMSDENW